MIQSGPQFNGIGTNTVVESSTTPNEKRSSAPIYYTISPTTLNFILVSDSSIQGLSLGIFINSSNNFYNTTNNKTICVCPNKKYCIDLLPCNLKNCSEEKINICIDISNTSACNKKFPYNNLKNTIIRAVI